MFSVVSFWMFPSASWVLVVSVMAMFAGAWFLSRREISRGAR